MKTAAEYTIPMYVPRRVRLDFAEAGGELYAGPYRAVNNLPPPPRGSFEEWYTLRVNLAEEILVEADVVVPTEDFGVPPQAEFRVALVRAAKQLLAGKRVFVGCGYGIGRTGTFLAALLKLHRELAYLLRQSREGAAHVNAVAEIRALYLPQAVETQAQKEFVEDLDVRGMARRLALSTKPTVVFDKRFWLG